MKLRKLNETDLAFFSSMLGERAFYDASTCDQYSRDHTEDLSFLPECVLKPDTVDEVSCILSYCNDNQLAVTPAGARTGLSGGALPVKGGVLLSMERFNHILQVDTDNLQVITEPGVITQVLQEEVQKYGLFYPPDPASKGSCFIGGNVSENSGGPKAVKYGVTKDYVLNLEVVLSDGSIIWTGANVLKNATGYNLTQLMIGSEGTLGIITKIVLRLLPHPTHDLLLLVPFFDAEEACKAVSAIFKAGVTPSGLEFMERDALRMAASYLNEEFPWLLETHQAHLLIEVDGFDPDQLMKECEVIYNTLGQFECDEILFAEDQAKKNSLWRLRRVVGEAVKKYSTYKEEDTVVPRFHLPELLRAVKKIGKEYGFESVCYGHAGDGNLHINILKGNLSEHEWTHELPKAIRKLFQEVVRLGGTLSGEHGIGYVQKPYMDLAFDATTLNLMKGIKDVFDPKGILNPGKIQD